MTQPEPEFNLPADFEQRCSETYKRLLAGEPMTIENIADQLGLPYEFFAGALAGYAGALGVLAMVDLSPPKPLN